MDIQIARTKIDRKLHGVSDIAEGIYRGVRKQGHREFAAYVFDVTNKLPSTAGDLSNYLDRVIGQSYFDQSNASDLRWNNYLYFVVSRGIVNSDEFKATKMAIEADRSYARKYIVSEDDFDDVLTGLDAVAITDTRNHIGDIVETWAEKLNELSLSEVLISDRPISQIVKTIAGGTAKKTLRTKRDTGMDAARVLVSGHLEYLNLRDFGRSLRSREFNGLGRVNLLFGSNGVGKTSFMEGLEFLFCGENRRSRSSQGVAVEGRFKSGKKVTTHSGQKANDFKTRQRHWYGTSGRGNENFLQNQFARFNFLNTDAAAELSLFKDIHRRGVKSNSESLSDLLSGHEVTEIWKRIEQIYNDIGDEVRAETGGRDVIAANLQSAELRLATLKAAPGELDSLFRLLLSDLERVRWKILPTAEKMVSLDDIERLSKTTSLLNVVRQLSWIDGPITTTTIRHSYEKLRPLNESIRNVLSEINNNEIRSKTLLVQSAGAVNRVNELDTLDLKAVDELVGLIHRKRDNELDLAENSAAFSALPSVKINSQRREMLGALTLERAQLLVSRSASVLQSRILQLEQKIHILTQTKSVLQVEVLRLVESAQTILKHRHIGDECPLCQTSFTPNELHRRMQKALVSPTDVELTQASLELKRAREESNDIQEELNFFEALELFCNTSSRPKWDREVETILVEVERLRILRVHLLAEQENITKRVALFADLNVTIERIELLCLPIDGKEIDDAHRINLRLARERALELKEYIDSQIVGIERETNQLKQTVRGLLAEAGIVDDTEKLSFAFALQDRLTFLILALASCEDALPYISIDPDADWRLLAAALDSLLKSAQTIFNLNEQDRRFREEFSESERQVLDRRAELSEISLTIKRLRYAHSGLREIISKHSLESATAEVVKAAHKVAGAIFNRVHSPSEYRITADAEIPLVRTNDGAAVLLDEISTGQRAAYALSMFLAMNAMVTDGPKIIMLDDPISQVDDLNALSFLDYLRNLVLHSDRQVFFATADEKMAGLFMHKFSFLGDEFKVLQLTR